MEQRIDNTTYVGFNKLAVDPSLSGSMNLIGSGVVQGRGKDSCGHFHF